LVWKNKELGEVCFTLAQGIKMKRVFQGTTWVEKKKNWGLFFTPVTIMSIYFEIKDRNLEKG